MSDTLQQTHHEDVQEDRTHEVKFFHVPGIVIHTFPVRMVCDVRIGMLRHVGETDPEHKHPNTRVWAGPLVTEVPIAIAKNADFVGNRWLPHVGERVLLIAMDRAWDKILATLASQEPEYIRARDVSDLTCIPEYVWGDESPKIPASVGDMDAYDLMVAYHRSQPTRLWMDDDTGNINIHADLGHKVSLGKENATHNTAVFCDIFFPDYFNKHTHFAVPAPFPSGPTTPDYWCFVGIQSSLTVWADNPTGSPISYNFTDSKGKYGGTTDDGHQKDSDG